MAEPQPFSPDAARSAGPGLVARIVAAWPFGKAGLAAFALLLLDMKLSQTALISPLSPLIPGAFALAGAIFGLTIFGKVLLSYPGNIRNFLFFGVLAGAIGGYVFFAIGGHLANRWYFGWSTAPFQTAYYPVLKVTRNRQQQHFFLIDPYGSGQETAILAPAGQPVLDDRYQKKCIAVLVRRGPGGMIQARTGGYDRPIEPINVEISDGITPSALGEPLSGFPSMAGRRNWRCVTEPPFSQMAPSNGQLPPSGE